VLHCLLVILAKMFGGSAPILVLSKFIFSILSI